MHKLQCLLVFCVAAICINGQGDDAILACGSRLPDLLSLVCQGNYNRPKKAHGDVYAYSPSEASSMDAGAVECRNLKLLERFNNENKREREQLAHAQTQFPFQTRLEAFDFGHFARNRRSITQECCKKTCTMAELQGYCHS